MEFLNTLVRVFDGGCVGFLEVLTIFLLAAAVYLGFHAFQKHKHLAQKLAHHHKGAVGPVNWWPVVIVGVMAVGFMFLTAWKYLFLQQ
jgi:hypothetical protein